MRGKWWSSVFCRNFSPVPLPYGSMNRVLRNLLLVCAFAAAAGFALSLFQSADPIYTVQEWLNRGSYAQYDPLIVDASNKYKVEPALIKALIWRESRFRPDKVGTSGERGLMQVGEAAARDWAKAEKIETFAPTDLFDPKVNLDAGVWYLAKAFERWKGKDDPIPFVLAEYNAGRKRVDRWVHESGKGDAMTAADLLHWIDFA